MFAADPFDRDVTYADAVATVAAAPAAWLPGTQAGYHAASAWRILGAIVERIDGRPIETYLHDEVIAPLHMTGSSLGISLAEQERLGDAVVPVAWKGHRLPRVDAEGTLEMVPYRMDRIHNEPWHVAKVEPGGGMRGPAHDLGRFYESLLGYGPAVLDPHTVEVMTAVHRYGMKDPVLGLNTPWGLGVQVEFTGGTTRRAFGHGGMASSRGLADPHCDLVLVVVCNGLAGFVEAERRVLEVTDAVYSALGDAVAPFRRPLERIGVGGLST